LGNDHRSGQTQDAAPNRVTCPPDHKHAETQYCYDFHRCRCDDCVTTRMAGRRRRYRQIAYGRHEGMVPALGTQRRIQGLQVLGWTCANIGDAAGGMAKRQVATTLTRDVVHPNTRDRINAAYLLLLRRGNGGCEMVARQARVKGWVSPFAWDNIDTDATPADVATDSADIDEVRVWNAVNGPARRHRLTTLERRECVRILWARRWTDRKIAEQIGCADATVLRIRERLELAAWPYGELIKRGEAA
jgi:hypothetical protein